MGVQILKFSSYTQLIIWRLRDGKKPLNIYINLYFLSIKILRVRQSQQIKQDLYSLLNQTIGENLRCFTLC